MCNLRSFFTPLLAVLLLQSLVVVVSAEGSANTWQTLTGNRPLVIARGGFSGLFPDSSSVAFQFAKLTSLPDVVLWCDVQLTKDGVGICAPDLRLDNSTSIARVMQNKDKLYLVNGIPTQGWFTVDFTLNELSLVSLTQGIYSRSERFDYIYPIQTVEDVANLKPPGLWLNIQHDAFFTQHNLSMRSYVLSLYRRVVINHLSSPEAGFLRSIVKRFNLNITKLVFRFLEPNVIEPSTNETYGSLSKNFTFIKTFASGILIPKSYIWPLDASNYLQPHTSIVSDAHKAGLEVFVSDFYNDFPLSYNYSYDPVTEYLSFVDNGDFSVDGVLSDFPVTPSATIAVMSNPYSKYSLSRNPKFRNSGNFLTLSDFLALAKNTSSLSGVLISIENAAYLIQQEGLPVTDEVLDVLSKAGYDDPTSKKVMIESTNSSVLMKFRDKNNYELVYQIEEDIQDAEDAALKDIKDFANSVVISKSSVFPESSLFLTGVTNVVPKLQSHGLSVYVETFSNEFVSQAWDFFSDSTVEINSYVMGVNISGVITDFPLTSARYKRNRCLGNNVLPPYMTPAQPGDLMQLISPFALPPAEPPNPVLIAPSVVEGPLPSHTASPPVPGGGATAVPPRPPNGLPKIGACIFLSKLAMLITILLLL